MQITQDNPLGPGSDAPEHGDIWLPRGAGVRGPRSLAAALLATLSSVCAAASVSSQALSGTPDQLGAVIEAALSETTLDVVWQVGTPFAGVDAAWQAPNRAQRLRAYFLEDGVRVVPRQRQTWTFGLECGEMARGSAAQDVGPAQIEVSGARVEYRREGFVEWYVNRPVGLEQGFHLPSRPLAESADGAPLELRFALAGDLDLGAVLPEHVSFEGPGGEALLAMRELVAFDATGKVLPCRFAQRDDRLAIVLEDRDAEYPLTIDPLIVSESVRLDVGFPPEADHFGGSIDVSGTLAIVGAPSLSGAAYIFRETGGVWELEAKLMPSGSQVSSSFGSDVAIRGGLAVVGARTDNEEETDSGAIYTYEYDGVQWDAEDKLYSTATDFIGLYGTSVAMISGWLFVGAPGEDGAAAGSGAVYIYKRSAGEWTLLEALRPDGAENARVGYSLDADGLRLVVGAPGQDAGSPVGGEVHVYRKAVLDDVWTLEDTLTASFTPDLGAAVAIEGDTIAAGAPHTGVQRGAVLFFRRNVDNSWTHFDSVFGSRDGARFGWSLAMDDSTGALRAIGGAPFDTGFFESSGSATIMKYEPLQHDVVIERELRAESQFIGSLFGVAVELTGTQAFVGTENDVIGGPYRSGTVQVFERSGSVWSAGERWMGTSQDATDRLGSSVAIEGDLAVVGSPWDDDNGANAGAAYVFERIDGAWELTARLAGFLFSQLDARLGKEVATDGERILVGAPRESVDGTVQAGAVYLFENVAPDGWSMSRRLTPSDPLAGAGYGWSLDIEGDLAVVGTGINTAYVHRRDGAGVWSEEQKLEGPHGSGFAIAVGIAGGEVLIGEPLRVGSPAVHHYREDAGLWTETETLTDASDGFGYALATSGARLVVGAHLGASAHLFELEQGAFVPSGTLERDDPNFGIDVAIDGETTVVSASGAVFAYQRVGELFAVSELIASDGPFTGTAPTVAASNGTVLLGHPRGSVVAEEAGAAYLYDLPAPDPIQSFGFGDGSIRPCPCGNDSIPGADEGCLNSTGSGARLRAVGSASLAVDDLTVSADQIPPGRSTQLFIGANRLIGLAFGDGLRVATVPFIRIPIRQASSAGSVTWANLHATGFWGPGDVRFFQAFYRDPGGPCGSGFNVTNAVQVVFED